MPVVQFLDQEEPQGLFDDGFFVRELAVLDLLPQKALQVVCERIGPRGWKNRGLGGRSRRLIRLSGEAETAESTTTRRDADPGGLICWVVN